MWADFYKGISLSLSRHPKPRLIKLMFLSGTLSHRRIRPRFFLFLFLAAVTVAFLMGAIRIPDSLATSPYWQEVLQ